jgi:glucose/arabinose dehydrogenase
MTRFRAAPLVAATISAVLLAACSGGNQPGSRTSSPGSVATSTAPSGSPTAGSAASTPASSPAVSDTPAPVHGSVKVDRVVATNINVPWGLALLPGGDLLVSSRDTRRITRINLASGRKTDLGEVLQARSTGNIGGEGGLLGVVLSPDFSQNHQLFIYYSTDQDNRIARLTYDQSASPGHQINGLKVILTGIPHGTIHNGGRLAFGPDGMLYATTGESGDPSLSQDKGSLGGKILRMTASGQPAPGNPNPHSVVWTYGHRNVQGLAWDRSGRLWASEFGDRKADELNLIQKDHNYGWPATQGRTDIAKYTSPVAEWGTEVDSPSGIAFAGGSIWMAALRGERLWRIPLDGARTAGRPEDFLTGEYGRLRSVLALDAHTLLVTTSNTDGRGTPGPADDRILELTVH